LALITPSFLNAVGNSRTNGKQNQKQDYTTRNGSKDRNAKASQDKENQGKRESTEESVSNYLSVKTGRGTHGGITIKTKK